VSEGKRIEELRRRREGLRRSGEEAVQRQRNRGKLSARERIEGLLDKGSFVELDPFVEHRATALGMDRRGVGDGVVTGFGNIEGRRVFVYSQDFTFMGGSLGEMHAKKICHVLDLALENGAPIIGFHDSGGARIQEGVASLAGYGEIFRRNVAASGVIPQIAVIAGPTAGGASYSPALMDIIIMIRGISTTFITGPRVIKQVTGEDVDMQRLGGAETHSSVSGVASLAVNSEEEGFAVVRRLLSYLPQNNLEDPPLFETVEPAHRAVDEAIPHDPRRAYDIRDVITVVVDGGSFFEIQPEFAANAVVGFARMEGRNVGVVASQPSVMAGCMTIDSSDKIARFVRCCDAFNLPVITFQDVPGYLPGVDQEHGGIIRHGAKVIYAYAEATVPKVTVIIRKSFGGAYIALGSRHLGADFVYALPQAEVAVMGAEGAVEIVYRREIAENPDRRKELIAEYRREFANPYRASKLGYIDDVIEPSEIRPRLIESLALLSSKRAKPHPPKRHGNMPV